MLLSGRELVSSGVRIGNLCRIGNVCDVVVSTANDPHG